MTTSLQEIRELFMKAPIFMCDKNIEKMGDNLPCKCQECDTNRNKCADFWLSLIKERDAELVVQIKKMKILEIGLLDENENGYNKAIKDVLLLLTTTPTEGGE